MAHLHCHTAALAGFIMPNTTVLILGATGRLGRACALAFAQAGWQVRAQSRSGRLVPELAGRCQAVAADPLTPQGLATLHEAAQGAAVVLNAWSPSAYTDAAWRAQVLPLCEVGIALAQRSGAWLMFPGNVYGFGRELPALLRLSTPNVASGPASTVKGGLRVAAEARLAQACAHAGLNALILRAGDFFGGHGPGTWLDLMMLRTLAADERARRPPRFAYPGPPDVPHAWAYLPDLAATFVALAHARQAVPQAWQGLRQHHFAGHTLTGAQWQEGIEAALNRRVQPVAAPWGLFAVLGWVVPTVRSVNTMRYLWQRPHALVDDTLAAAVAPQAVPGTAWREAIAQAVTALRTPNPQEKPA